MSETTTSDQLTVLLVHGAFADSSSWAGVIERLQAKGTKVIAAANPLRGLKSDSAYVGALIDEIPGPVLAVGHSYGGAVISNAATGKSNVVGLVFVAAFAPDEGEVLLEVTGTSKDSVLGPALVPHQYAIDGGTLGRVHDRSCESPRRVRGGPPRRAGERGRDGPTADSATWRSRTRPVHRRGSRCRRGRSWRPATGPPGPTSCAPTPSAPGADITEVAGSHLIMISQPQAVVDVIESAIAKVG